MAALRPRLGGGSIPAPGVREKLLRAFVIPGGLLLSWAGNLFPGLAFLTELCGLDKEISGSSSWESCSFDLLGKQLYQEHGFRKESRVSQ
jgi:hypothetical protein